MAENQKVCACRAGKLGQYMHIYIQHIHNPSSSRRIHLASRLQICKHRLKIFARRRVKTGLAARPSSAASSFSRTFSHQKRRRSARRGSVWDERLYFSSFNALFAQLDINKFINSSGRGCDKAFTLLLNRTFRSYS